MHDHPALFAALIERNGRHEATAHGSPVTGTLGINVLAEQTPRTVIAITALPQGLNRIATVFAEEGFLAGDEGHATKYIKDFLLRCRIHENLRTLRAQERL